VIEVPRDEAICAKIQEALDTFYESFDRGMEKLRNSK
jgi:hypothetical protein